MAKKWLTLLLTLSLIFSLGALAKAEEEEVEFDLDEYLNITPQPEETPAPASSEEVVYETDGTVLVTMTFTGDFTIGRNMNHSGKSIFETELAKQGGDKSFMFRSVRDILLSDDWTVINFEGTLTTQGVASNKKGNDFAFRAEPEYADILLPNGVEGVTLENNHVLDMGEEGLAETRDNLLSAGVKVAQEGSPSIFTVKGITFGNLAYQTFGGRHDEIIAKLPEDIAALREAGCEIIIVSYHWGAELDYEPNSNQVRLGRATIDAGADLVIGHHSHRINPIEYYNGGYICYSLGNFSFCGNNKPSDMSSYLFQIRFRRGLDGEVKTDGIKLIPGRISSRTDYNDFAFTPYTKTENIEAVLKLLKNYGKKLTYALETYPLKWADEE